MATPLPQKSTVETIRERFDNDVERFSHLETGQSATIDSALCLELVARAAAATTPGATTPGATTLLDLGCGAGNYALKVLESMPNLAVHLVDLSGPMLARARERVGAATSGAVRTFQADLRELDLPENSVDIVVSAATLHHLRDESEWRATFKNIFRWLSPGGSLWVFDLVEASTPSLQAMHWARYGEYLETLGGETHREKVFAYIDAEDSPRPLVWQLELLRETGFVDIDILHKNGPFAAFGGRKP